MANEATIKAMKVWCSENYTKGADTMVECWDTNDYAVLIDSICDGNEERAWNTLKNMAAVYEDRQANAHYEGL